MSESNENLKNLFRPIVQYVNEELEKSEERLKETFLNRVDQILPTVVKEDRSPRDSRMA